MQVFWNYRLYPSICLHESYPVGSGFFIFGEEECKEVLSFNASGFMYQKSKEDKLFNVSKYLMIDHRILRQYLSSQC